VGSLAVARQLDLMADLPEISRESRVLSSGTPGPKRRDGMLARAVRWGATGVVLAAAAIQFHSNETVWPWYSNIAPLSWLVQRDVDEGRRKTNFSESNRPQKNARESAETVQKGTMPPWYYPWARLSPAERHELIQGLAVSVGDPQKAEE
jgi:hypothetical protein